MDAGVDNIPLTQMNGDIIEAVGSFSYMNRVFKIAYQNSVTDQLHLGVSAVGYLNEIYTYTGNGYSIDLELCMNFQIYQYRYLREI